MQTREEATVTRLISFLKAIRTTAPPLVHPYPDPMQANDPRLRRRNPLRSLANAVGIALHTACACTPSPAPKTLAAALHTPGAKAWASAYDAEINRYSKAPKTWYYDDQRPDD